VADKMTKKELKQPDALQRAGLEASSWLEGKEKLLVAGVVALVLLGLVVAIVDALGDRSQRRAQSALGAALEPVLRSVAEEGAPPPEGADTEKPPFASQQAKDEAVVSSLTAFRKEHPGTRSAATAGLPLGQALYRLGRHDEAIKAFDDFLAGVEKDAPLRAVALEGKGYAHEAKGELDRALAAYEQLVGHKGGGFLDGMGKLHRGRVLELQNKRDEAAQVYAAIPAEHPNSAAARQALERLNLLASQGVNVPVPKAPTEGPGTGGAARGEGS
jgi:tetratricopeptide (TPR) repeat protein